jgi:hypothetical protein
MWGGVCALSCKYHSRRGKMANVSGALSELAAGVPAVQQMSVGWHFHKWTRWDDWRSGEDSYGYPVLIQERRCLVCNRAERRKVVPPHI